MKKKSVVNILLVLSSFVVSIMVSEVFLQVIKKPKHVYSGWLPRIAASEKNQLGFRGRKINYTDNDYVILLLGDSQVQAESCAFDWLPENRLEYHLNSKAGSMKKVKVYSIGAGGYGQDQQLQLLQIYYKTYRADMVVLWQTPGNDIWNNVFPTHWPRNGTPKPTFRLVDGELYGPSEEFLEELWWSKIKLFALANRMFGIINRDDLWEKYLPQPYKPLKDYEGKICNDWQERWDKNLGLMRDENLSTEKSHLAIHLTPVSQRMRYGLDLTKALLGKIQNLAATHKSFFVTFNTKLANENSEDCPGDTLVHLLNGKYFVTSTKQYDDSISFLNENLLSLTIPITMAEWRVGPENSHLNEHATDQVMEDLAVRMLPLIK